MDRITAIRKAATDCEKRTASLVFVLPRTLIFAVLAASAYYGSTKLGLLFTPPGRAINNLWLPIALLFAVTLTLPIVAIASSWRSLRAMTKKRRYVASLLVAAIIFIVGVVFSAEHPVYGAPALFLGVIGVSLLCLPASLAERRAVEDRLRQHQQLLNLISQIAAGLVSVANDKIDEQITLSLARLRAFLGADRASVFEIATDKEELCLVYTADEGPSNPTPLCEGNWVLRQLRLGRDISITACNQLPRDAPERMALAGKGIESVVIAPLGTRPSVAGILSVVSRTEKKDWPSDLTDQMHVVGNLFYAALQRKKALPESEQETVLGLSGRVIKAQDEERQRIARELHDDIGQRLTLLMIEIDRLQRASDSSLQPSMLQLLDEAQSISDCVRNLSHNLHPARVDLLPLGIALSGLCREFTQRTSIEVRFEECNIPALLPIEIKVCLYRVAQEALQNIAKHSRASRAEVELSGDANNIRLRVDDDGVGFVVHQPPAITGLGLASMRERLTSVAGSIKVTAAPRQGTRIEACVPLHRTTESGLAECA